MTDVLSAHRARAWFTFSGDGPFKSLLVRCLAAAGLVAAATLGQSATGGEFILFYPSIVVIAMLCGVRLALLATLVEASLAGIWFLRDADLSVRLTRPLLYLAFGGATAYLTDAVSHSRSQVRQLKERFALLFESNILGIIAWKITGEITDANDAFLRMMGFSRTDLEAGRLDWRDLTPPEWRVADVAAVRELSATGKHEPFEKEYFRKDGSRVPVVIGATHYPNSTTEGLTFVLDISEQKAAQRALEHIRDELRNRVEDLDRSNADLAQFAYVASHDLKEPLRVVRSHLQFVQRLLGENIPEKASLHMSVVMEASGRMYRLVDDLLDYARAGVEVMQPETVEMRALVEDVVKSLDSLVEETKATVVIEALPPARGVPSQLRQLFQNLITNALKFRGTEPPRIVISGAITDTERATYSVRDNGIGIAPEYANRIFEIFQRLHDRGSYSGTGIGLSVCKKIVERHSGRIWVESRPGEGSDFRFTLRHAKELR